MKCLIGGSLSNKLLYLFAFVILLFPRHSISKPINKVIANDKAIKICAMKPSTPELIDCFADLRDRLEADLDIQVRKASKNKPDGAKWLNGENQTFEQSLNEAQLAWRKNVKVTCRQFIGFYGKTAIYGPEQDACEMQMLDERIKLFKWLNSSTPN